MRSRSLLPASGVLLLSVIVSLSAYAQERSSPTLGSAYVDEGGGLWVRDESGWQSGGEGLSRRVVYPFDASLPRRVTDVSVGQESALLTTAQKLYRGVPGEWEALVDRREFGRHAYLTAVAGEERIAVGTSFHGLYLSDDRGESWREFNGPLDTLSRGGGYFEEIGSLAFVGESLYLLTDYGRSLLEIDPDDPRRPARPRPLPEGVSRAAGLRRSAEGSLFLDTPVGVQGEVETFSRTPDGWISLGSERPPGPSPTLSEEEAERRRRASGRRGIYLPVPSSRGQTLEEMIGFARRNGINAFVIDFKDDWGRVTYNSRLPLPREIGAVRSYLDLEELVDRLDEAGIYLIGRIVVFKDRELHGYQESRLALRDTGSGEPWGVPVPGAEGDEARPGSLREHWVDQYSPEVWEYNVALAEELAARGVDEIQFDYIRFPSDGPTERIAHPYHREGMSREDALESFLTLARKRIAVPIGVDVFGFNGFYEMDYLGQNIKLLAGLVDVISPMWYPSHFSREFLPGMSYLDWARAIHELGSRRGRLITGDRAIIRPYVQAFLIGGELEMDEPTYRRYLVEQLEGAEAGGSDGYLLWNFSGRYYMVE